MTYRRSVSRKLARGLALVGLVGALLLLAAVVVFYSLTFADLTAQDALIHAARAMLKHVALPVIVLM
ncbi:MAG: sensor histidine kinase, partial [Novosphingobium sp.]|nr:sensor histidine kinase [Novosphingobium sp.]